VLVPSPDLFLKVEEAVGETRQIPLARLKKGRVDSLKKE
jgi:hypothetical protein